MKFSRDLAGANSVRNIDRSAVLIGDRRYTGNVGLTSDTVIENWPAVPVASLTESDLGGLLEHTPELLIIGTGWAVAHPPRELIFALARRGIGVEVMGTPAACRTFNILIGEGRLPAAVLYLDS